MIDLLRPKEKRRLKVKIPSDDPNWLRAGRVACRRVARQVRLEL